MGKPAAIETHRILLGSSASASLAAENPGVVVSEPERMPTAIGAPMSVSRIIAAHVNEADPIMTTASNAYDFALTYTSEIIILPFRKSDFIALPFRLFNKNV